MNWLPVVDLIDDTLVGVVTRSDLLKVFDRSDVDGVVDVHSRLGLELDDHDPMLPKIPREDPEEGLRGKSLIRD